MGGLPPHAGRERRLGLTPRAGGTTWARYGVVLAGGFVSGNRAIDAIQAWRHWREVALSDPSAADLYRTTFWLDLGIAAGSLAVACLVWWLLRPSAGPRLP